MGAVERSGVGGQAGRQQSAEEVFVAVLSCDRLEAMWAGLVLRREISQQ